MLTKKETADPGALLPLKVRDPMPQPVSPRPRATEEVGGAFVLHEPPIPGSLNEHFPGFPTRQIIFFESRAGLKEVNLIRTKIL